MQALGTFIGYQGNGSLTVENGSEMQTYNARVGYLPGSTGSVQVSSSTWRAGTFSLKT
jgi:hypothetical protein